jgi:hypothetical protein
MHLRPEELLDLAEGARAESAVPHLLACSVCRQRLADLRVAIAVVEVDAVSRVPEPPPVFWDLFQQRVSEAVVAERRRRSAALWRLIDWVRPPVLVPLTAAAALAVTIVLVNLHGPRMRSSTDGPGQGASVLGDGGAAPFARADLLRDSLDDDPSLQLIADLAAGIDWSAADVAGMTVGLNAPSSADHAVVHMKPEDLKELQRLLRLELGT